jgi:hypothetical protein
MSIDPVSIVRVHEVFLLQKMEPERGVLPSIFAILGLHDIAGSIRTSLSGFLYE